jgi:hypothetical protein
MRKLLMVLAFLAPAPALADVICTIERQCGGGTCEPFQGGPMALREVGDLWQVELQGDVWEGYATTTVETDEISIVIPPMDGLSGLVSVYPSGQGVFTVHANGPDGMVVISGTGLCEGVGG